MRITMILLCWLSAVQSAFAVCMRVVAKAGWIGLAHCFILCVLEVNRLFRSVASIGDGSRTNLAAALCALQDVVTVEWCASLFCNSCSPLRASY